MARRSPVAAEGYPASANGATAAPAAEPPERQADGVGAADASGAQAADFTGKWLLVNTIASSSRTGGTTGPDDPSYRDRKSTRLNSSHGYISYAVFCLKKKK